MDSNSHRRFNWLTGKWILCSPHRASRPWQGQQESNQLSQTIEYDPKCYLCPGNVRANNDSNPNYKGTFIFENDFPALQRKQDSIPTLPNSLLQAQAVSGVCKVVVFSPSHSKSMASMSEQEVTAIVEAWTSEYLQLSQVDSIKSIQIFENKGAAMGCSNPHPHGQIWATSFVPEEHCIELEQFKSYLETNQRCLLCDYCEVEQQEQSRIVHENELFLCIVPFWAVWPFETLIVPKRHVRSLNDLSRNDQSQLANILIQITQTYDRLFNCSFPYSMGLHMSPCLKDQSPCCFHIHFYPPLLRSQTVRKFLVGFEMFAETQRDLTAEQAAQRLRNA